jgi:hypothetical protein
MSTQQKFGRHAKRSPAAARYRSTGKREINKARNIAKAKAAGNKVSGTPTCYKAKGSIIIQPEVKLLSMNGTQDYRRHATLYTVESSTTNIVLDVTPYYDEARKALAQCTTPSRIVKRGASSPVVVLKN